MTARLNPYIAFNGNARMAMEFYQQVFGGELHVNTFGEYGDPAAANADHIMHSQLDTTSGFTLMGSDTPPGQSQEPGGNISVSLSGSNATDGAELRHYWAKLSDGGTVIVPFATQMWGDEFGMCTDQFGTTWLINISAG